MRKAILKIRILFLFLVVVVCSLAAQADPIVVSSPIVITSGGGQNYFPGHPGFSFTFQNSSGSLFTNIRTLDTSNPIGYGQASSTGLLDLSFRGAGSDVIGTFTYNDITYYSFSNLNFAASAPIPLNLVLGQEFHVLSNFTFTGALWGGDREDPFTTRELIRITTLMGSGVVDATFISNAGGLSYMTSMAYTFQATPSPEPASLVLLASGIGALAFRRFRR